MGKWLERLREHEKNKQMGRNSTDKTPIIPEKPILGVLSVRSGRETANFSSTTEEARATFDERAAILEYDAGLPREEAERLACVQINTTIH